METVKMYDDLTEFLLFLESIGELVRVNRKVDSKLELAAVQKKINDELGKVVLFTNVDGKDQKILGNLYASRRVISSMFGVTEEKLVDLVIDFNTAILHPVKYVEQAPCQEVVLKYNRKKDLKNVIPITWNNEKDSGFFLTAAVIVCKDPTSNKVNAAICRLEYKKDHFTVQLVENQHTSMIYNKYRELNQDMPVAIVLGADPIFMFASESGIPYAYNEFEYAGAILGRSFEVVQCMEIDQYVPAKAQIVLEGHISVSKEEMEGPMGEVTQYYGGKSTKPVVEIACITHRKDPISQNIISGSIEEHSLLAVPMEARILFKLRQLSSKVISVNILPFFFNCIIQVDDFPGIQNGITKNILLAALSEPWIKVAVIVNKDVNLYNKDDINWAIATRVDFTSDVLIINDMLGFPLDPMKQGATSTISKIGIDATVNPLDKDNFIRSSVVGYEAVNLEDWL